MHHQCIPFFKPNIGKLENRLSKIPKNTCNIPKSAANIFTHLSTEDFGINTTSMLSNYINCIKQQLIHAFNDPKQLGKIYQRFTKHIYAKHG